MSSWDFWSVISLAGILQSILVLVFLAANRKNHFLPNLFAFLVVVWLIWMQMEFLVIRRSFVIHTNIFFGSRHGVWLLLGPLVYDYVLSLLGKTTRVTAKTILHYIPFIIFAIVLPLTGAINISDRVISYGMLSILKFPILAHSWLDTVYGYVFILQFVHAFAYLAYSIKIIVKSQQELKRSSSDNRQEKLSWLKSLVAAMSLSTIASVVFILILLTSRWYVREMDFVYIFPLTLCIYILSYFAILQPFTFRQNDIPQRYRNSVLSRDVSIEQFTRLKELIVQKKLYLNPELRLNDLSEISETSSHQISEVINREAGVSFFEFINQFRINEVINTIASKKKENQRINVLEIAFAAGFNNKVSFNRYFKKQTGLTPSAFIQNNSVKRG